MLSLRAVSKSTLSPFKLLNTFSFPSRSGFQARRITAAINDPYGLVPQPLPPFGAPPGFPGVRLVNVGERIRPRGLLERPPGTRVKVSYSADGSELSIRIPAKGFTGQTAFLGAFAGAWNAFLVTWLFGEGCRGGADHRLCKRR